MGPRDLAKLNHTNVRLKLNLLFPAGYTLVEEYVSEFEHQDGRDCWKNTFETLEQVVTDFELYCSSSGRPVTKGANP